MTDSLESLEEKFRRVEEANERRVLDNELNLSGSELVDPSIEPRKHFRKKSLSVTQFGQHSDEQGENGSYSSSSLSAVASKSTFYHTLANPRSLESLISENTEDGTWHTEEHHVIEIERIAGRQILSKSVGSFIPRRLSRSRSQTLQIPKERSLGNMVIDVSVEQTTSDASHVPAEAKSQTSMAYAARSSRRRSATTQNGSHANLVERAKDFARKLRPKNKADPPSSSRRD